MINEPVIKKEILEAINEELSISDSVKWKAKEIAKIISDNIALSEKKERIANGVSRKKFEFSDVFLEKNIRYAVNFYNFDNRSVFNAESKNINCDDGSTTTDGKRYFWVTVNCYGISGQVVFENLCGTVQHELNHIYQAIKGDGRITKFDKIYSTASAFLGCNDEKIRSIAEVIYFSYSYEQDGFINGLYGELRSKNIPSPSWEDLKDTGFYADFARFLNAVEYVDANREFLSEICFKKFGFDIQTVVSNGRKALRRLKEKIGKVLIKLRKDYEEEGVRFLSDAKGNSAPYLN
jgi:hypothetical protein